MKNGITITRATICLLAVLVFAGFVSGQDEKAADTPCGKESKAGSGGKLLVVRDVSLIDGTGRMRREPLSLVIKDGRIKEILPAGEFKTPPGTVIVDGKGKYAIPGLWDMHVHFKNSTETALPVYLANGVTSVRDMVGAYDFLADLRRKVTSGKRIGSRIKFSGPSLESPESVERAKSSGKSEDFDRTRIVVEKPEDAAPAVKRLKEMGVDFIKLRTWASEEVYFAIAEAARRENMQLVGHPPEFDPLKVAREGQTGIEHGFFPYPLSKYSEEQKKEIFEAMRANGVHIVPTIVAWAERVVPLDEAKAIAADRDNKIDPRRRYVAPELLAYWEKQLEDRKPLSEESLKGWHGAIDTMASDVGEMYRAGVPVMPGTDVAGPLIFPGFSLHDELVLFVEKVGLTPMQAIVSATRVPAGFMGMKECLGTLEEGKIADIVLLDADPLADIRNTRKIHAVIRGGRLYDRKALDDMLEEVSRLHRSKTK